LRSLGANSCDLLRSSACVGFCVALLQGSSFSSGKTLLFSILLGELSWHRQATAGACHLLRSPNRTQRRHDRRSVALVSLPHAREGAGRRTLRNQSRLGGN
jgi:hypothetical protein